MDRVAVLVDAGYFFAAGSALVSGTISQSRSAIIFDEKAAVRELQALAQSLAQNSPLLRIYWYDGASRKTGPTAEHGRLAHCDNIKVRLGFINSAGQQKGVDSLIVTDLVELARNRAVGDVVLVSGDEDVRIGVQLAQSFGVRVHLVGIKPSAGNQSVELRQEADTCTELDLAVLKKIISMRLMAAATLAVNKKPATAAPKPAASPAPATVPIALSAIVNPSGAVPTASWEDVVNAALSEMTPAEIKGTVAYMAANSNNVPNELDGKVLARCRAKLGQYLDDESRKKVRKYLRQRLKDAAAKA
jgi:uncharacterized LabA/DUF88 family protein